MEYKGDKWQREKENDQSFSKGTQTWYRMPIGDNQSDESKVGAKDRGCEEFLVLCNQQ